MKVDKLTLGSFAVNCYIVDVDNNAIIIDPGSGFEEIEKYLSSKGLNPLTIINTHGHYDHIGAVNQLLEKYEIDFYIHQQEERYLKDCDFNLSLMVAQKAYRVNDYKIIDSKAVKFFAGLGLEILHTPGHTPGSISIMGNGWLFCGDLLFKQAAGRTDLPGGDSRELKNSLKKIRKMDRNLVIYPGHGQKTSLGWELDNNYYLSHDFLGKE